MRSILFIRTLSALGYNRYSGDRLTIVSLINGTLGETGAKELNEASRVVKNSSVVSILRVLTNQGGDPEKLEAYPLRYAEDFFGGSNEAAVKLSKCGTGDRFSPPC